MGRIFENIPLSQLREIIATDRELLEDPAYAVDHDAIRSNLSRSEEILARRESTERPFSGDLGSIIQEAFGHAEDCGRTYNAVPHVLGYIERTYDTGLYGFVMDVKPLW
jgi:hypothetical protein